MYTIQSNPVCSFIASICIIIFSLYLTGAIKTIPCEKDMISIFVSQFIHTDFIHLMSNLYGLYTLSRVERKLGLKKFLILIISLSILNSIFEIILHKIVKTPCSIGFSAIEFGLFSFEIIYYNNKIDYYILSAIVSDIVISKIRDKQISLASHMIGIICGIIMGLIFKKIY